MKAFHKLPFRRRLVFKWRGRYSLRPRGCRGRGWRGPALCLTFSSRGLNLKLRYSKVRVIKDMLHWFKSLKKAQHPRWYDPRAKPRKNLIKLSSSCNSRANQKSQWCARVSYLAKMGIQPSLASIAHTKDFQVNLFSSTNWTTIIQLTITIGESP